MELKDVIKGRRSIRKYQKGVEIPDEHIKSILEAAMMAPSAKNIRPWEFVVLKSEDAKNRAVAIHPYAKYLSDASVGILVCALPEKQEGVCEGFYPQDCGAAIMNILLKSYDLGYGSCWCGIYPRVERVESFKDEFNLKSMPIALVVIGKADETPSARGYYDDEKVTVL